MGIPINTTINTLITPSQNTIDMISRFETYFEENSIYKTFFICSCDEEVYDVLIELENNNHSVSVLFNDDIYDERDNFYNKILNFRTNMHRIFLISYQTWHILNSELKVYLLPHQNLIAFGNVSDDGIKYINNWLYNAKQCGFIEEEPRILQLVPSE